MNRRFLSGTPDTELGRTDSIFIPLSSPKRARPNATRRPVGSNQYVWVTRRGSNMPSGVLMTRSAVRLALTVAMIAALLTVPTIARADSTCMTDVNGSYVKDLCIAAPEDGATVSGNVTVVGTVAPVNGPRTQKVEFYLDDEYVLTDYRSSSNSSAVFDFVLPTEFWVDGIHRLEMLAITRAEAGIPSYTTQRVGIDLTFANGIASVPPNTNSFTPSQGRPVNAGEAFTVAAVGDGASGEPNATAVTDMLVAQDPNLFLYLGDVYEKGTRTEFHNWYGDESRQWGRLRSITNPTIGNHEYENGVAPGYFDYWDNAPNFYSYDIAGWHFISLNSTNLFRDNPIQFNWLLADIAASDAKCTVAYWHDPRWSIGTQGDEPKMQEEWAALVEAGVDVFLGGNDHNYQRWEPLGPEGQLRADGAVQFVAGAGGHGVRPFAPGESDANPRVAKAYDTLDAFGALFLNLYDDRADFRYLDVNGVALDQGTIPCRDAILPGFRGELQTIRNELDAAAAGMNRDARDRANEAVAELDKTLSEDQHWDAEGAPSEADGKDVFDKVKKAVDKLRDVDNPPPPIVTAQDSLVAVSRDMAQTRIDDAVAGNGNPAPVLKALEHMDKALVELAEGEPHKAVDEYKKAWEEASAAGQFTPIGYRGQYLDIANGLVAAWPGLTGEARDKAGEAVDELGKAIADDTVWSTDGVPSDADGDEAFKKAKGAVEKLLDAENPPAIFEATTNELVAFSAAIASLKIDAAITGGGDPSKIDDALEHIDKALEKLAKGEPHKAIDEYKKAWENARDAL